MDVLAARIILRPADPPATRRFYGEDLGLAVAREFGPPDAPAQVFFAGPLLIEISGQMDAPARAGTAIWLQVRDVAAEVARLADRGIPIVREPRTESWGLIEAWIADPDGTPIVLVQVPADHPLRRDTRRLDD
ncbi:VOC family protein [Nakamurella multipartita]|uniref:Glyoxalase/bleomycin resistance protein/dioxygenase n=1 Tax=Nakamurella multipartita (strain ATCC 700099 / DSM 44233 / CIP 104796 / JCM 9543 / NBRC 105858 / Y-104) TaxID=479431 RepID=C8XIF6_NAKMY|nr:VOC family protein [Nakamurella multipartita]ACV80421.1 Glyoxalase/bleomycin resistance protein/dioxygenase [Nakamurella multipartita DSM 44233]